MAKKQSTEDTAGNRVRDAGKASRDWYRSTQPNLKTEAEVEAEQAEAAKAKPEPLASGDTLSTERSHPA